AAGLTHRVASSQQTWQTTPCRQRHIGYESFDLLCGRVWAHGLGRRGDLQDVTYRRPATIQEAVQLLADNGPTARVLAGGTDIIVMARERRRDTTMFVDIKALPGFIGIDFDASTGLTLGAATPCYQIYRNEMIQRLYPCLVDSASLIGGTAIQGRA